MGDSLTQDIYRIHCQLPIVDCTSSGSFDCDDGELRDPTAKILEYATNEIVLNCNLFFLSCSRIIDQSIE